MPHKIAVNSMNQTNASPKPTSKGMASVRVILFTTQGVEQKNES
jgi:hypothetical protein